MRDTVGATLMNPRTPSPLFPLTCVVAVVGSLLPAWALVRGGGLTGSLGNAGLLAAIWGFSPFVLPPVAAWIARRHWVRVMILVLVSVSVLFGLTHYLVILPRQASGQGVAGYFLLPIWQWPMSLLGGVLALLVPSAAEEAAQESGVDQPVPPSH
jgi:hypothetical protein